VIAEAIARSGLRVLLLTSGALSHRRRAAPAALHADQDYLRAPLIPLARHREPQRSATDADADLFREAGHGPQPPRR